MELLKGVLFLKLVFIGSWRYFKCHFHFKLSFFNNAHCSNEPLTQLQWLIRLRHLPKKEQNDDYFMLSLIFTLISSDESLSNNLTYYLPTVHEMIELKWTNREKWKISSVKPKSPQFVAFFRRNRYSRRSFLACVLLVIDQGDRTINGWPSWQFFSRQSCHGKNLWAFDDWKRVTLGNLLMHFQMPDLETKLSAEMKANCTVIACRFPFPNWNHKVAIGEGIDTVWVYKWLLVIKNIQL